MVIKVTRFVIVNLICQQQIHGELKHYLGKSKIGKQYSKPTITYPTIRLPVHCSEAIGTSVQIYKSEHAGQTVFVIIPDNRKSETVRQEVAQPASKVAQLETEINLESRLLAVESSIER